MQYASLDHKCAGPMALFIQQHGAPGALGGVVMLPVHPGAVQHGLLYDSYHRYLALNECKGAPFSNSWWR